MLSFLLRCTYRISPNWLEKAIVSESYQQEKRFEELVLRIIIRNIKRKNEIE